MLIRQTSAVNAIILGHSFSQPEKGPGVSHSQPITVTLPVGAVKNRNEVDFRVQNRGKFGLLKGKWASRRQEDSSAIWRGLLVCPCSLIIFLLNLSILPMCKIFLLPYRKGTLHGFLFALSCTPNVSHMIIFRSASLSSESAKS